jgi:hypothetical protein
MRARPRPEYVRNFHIRLFVESKLIRSSCGNSILCMRSYVRLRLWPSALNCVLCDAWCCMQWESHEFSRCGFPLWRSAHLCIQRAAWGAARWTTRRRVCRMNSCAVFRQLESLCKCLTDVRVLHEFASQTLNEEVWLRCRFRSRCFLWHYYVKTNCSHISRLLSWCTFKTIATRAICFSTANGIIPGSSYS